MPVAQGGSTNASGRMRCDWVDFRLSTKRFEQAQRSCDVAIVCEESTAVAAADFHDEEHDEEDDAEKKQSLLSGLRWLSFKNHFTHTVVLKQKQPDSCQISSNISNVSVGGNKQGHRWVTVMPAVTLMQDAGSDNENGDALGWHQVDLKQYLNDNFMTTIKTGANTAATAAITTKYSHHSSMCLLHFRLLLSQPAPWPVVHINHLQCTVGERPTRADLSYLLHNAPNGDVNPLGSVSDGSSNSSNSSNSSSHRSLRMRTSLERASTAAIRLALQVRQMEALNTRYENTRWRHEAAKHAARDGGLDAVFELRSGARYQATLDVLYDDYTEVTGARSYN